MFLAYDTMQWEVSVSPAIKTEVKKKKKKKKQVLLNAGVHLAGCKRSPQSHNFDIQHL
jgi:uncharacterized lipoprotein YajG